MLKNAEDVNSPILALIEKFQALDYYTDGSKIADQATGSACYCPKLDIQIKKTIDSCASVFTAECIALSAAFDLALQNQNQNVLIFTDSLSCLQSLQSTKLEIKTNRYIYEIKKKYNSFMVNNSHNTRIRLFWVPSHIGINGNEKADSLAKSATSSPDLNITQIPFTDLHLDFKKSARASTKNTIVNEGLNKGKLYFKYFYNTSSKPWFSGNCTLKRDFIVTISRCRANHYSLADSLHRLKFVSSPKCRCYCANEDLNHVLWQCHLYNSAREKLVKNLRKVHSYPPLCIESFLAKPDTEACLYIFDFLNECNINV